MINEHRMQILLWLGAWHLAVTYSCHIFHLQNLKIKHITRGRILHCVAFIIGWGARCCSALMMLLVLCRDGLLFSNWWWALLEALALFMQWLASTQLCGFFHIKPIKHKQLLQLICNCPNLTCCAFLHFLNSKFLVEMSRIGCNNYVSVLPEGEVVERGKTFEVMI